MCNKMGCEKVKEGVGGGLRMSMERRRLVNAKTTAMRHRKYQDLRGQREQDETRKAKEILQFRKKERARLNAYIHSTYQTSIKPLNGLKGQRNAHNGEEIYKRPPWSTSLLRDHEAIIRLRQKEIAVANAGIGDAKKPTFDRFHQIKDIVVRNAMLDARASDSQSPLDDNFCNQSKVSATDYDAGGLQNNNPSPGLVTSELEDLEGELYDLAMERQKFQSNVDANLLMAEDEVFRDYSSKMSLGSFPPMVSSPRVASVPLKSCLKSSKDTWKVLCEQGSTSALKQAHLTSSIPRQSIVPGTGSVASPESPCQMNYSWTASSPTSTSVATSFMEHASICSLSPVDATLVSSRSEFTNSASKQETSESESPLWSPRLETTESESLHSPSKKETNEETTGCSEEDLFIASLDSEAATTRLIADVIAVQSRLEDCKLKPLDFRDLTEQSLPIKGSGCGISETDASPEVVLDECHFVRETRIDMARRLSEQTLNKENMLAPSYGNHLESYTEEERDWTNTRNEVSHATTGVDKAMIEMGGSHTDYIGLPVAHEETATKKLESQVNPVHRHNRDGLEGGQIMLNGKPKATAWQIEWSPEERPPSRKKYLEPTTSGHNVGDAGGIPTTYIEEKPRSNDVLFSFPSTTTLNIEQTRNSSGVSKCTRPLSSMACQKTSEPQCNKQGEFESYLLSRERTSGDMTGVNVGYRDISEVPRPKQKCFYSSQGPLQTGYSHARNSSQIPRPNVSPVSIGSEYSRRRNKPVYHDSSADKENYRTGMCVHGSDEELSILASLERLDWKLAAISARYMNSGRVSLASQGQSSTKSAPTVICHGEPSSTMPGRASVIPGSQPRKWPVNPLRPSSAKVSQRPPRAFRRRQVVGVTNKCQDAILHPYP